MSSPNQFPAAWPAPAKLNLFLHITGRRDDGYHLLQTVFQFLDFGDELRFRARDDGAINRVTDLPGVPAGQDLVVRAALALREAAGTAAGADIEVTKRLPMGGGLGGGSSNAATVLVALNHLWGCRLSAGELAAIGLRLGADVPIFVHGHAAWAEGVGEQLSPVDPPEPWYVVLAPPVTVSTAEVFSDPQLIRNCPPITIRDFLAGQGSNVCEPLVRRRYPEVDAALEALSHYGAARMTGTGASVFAAFGEEADARQALEQLGESWQGFVARGRNTSPLRELIDY